MTGRTSATALLVTVAALFALAQCGGGSDSSSSPPRAATSTTRAAPDPVGLVAIGHSGLTGTHSDPNTPDTRLRENSWATGTNPAVNSVYQRLVAVRPETAGHVFNGGVNGARAETLDDQGAAALEHVPAPALVLVQTLDNDIRCDGTDSANVTAFGKSVAAGLAVITKASPKSQILIVSQIGRPAEFAQSLTDSPAAVQRFSGTGACDLFDPDGTLNAGHVAALTSIVEGYEAEQVRVCARVPQCDDDGGALAAFQDDVAYLGDDLNHLNVQGHAQEAATLWPTVSQVLGLK